MTGSHEVLAGEAIQFAERAAAPAVDVSLRSLTGRDNLIFGIGRVPEVDAATADMARRAPAQARAFSVVSQDW